MSNAALAARVVRSNAIIREALEQFRPSHAFALFSGGHDSLVTASIAMHHPEVIAAIHANTGIGVEDTRLFVRRTCADQGWPLIERTPPELSYEQMVLKYGFPGPGAHTYPFSWLKQRTFRQIIREHRVGRRPIVFVTGVRQQESERRMGHVEPIKKDGRIVWVSPLCKWTASDVGEYIEAAGLQRNEVVDFLHMSGECLCGAFARKGELDEIGLWYPEVVAQIRSLEGRAEEADVPCRWGVRPPKRFALRKAGQMELNLCWSCSRRGPGEEAA